MHKRRGDGAFIEECRDEFLSAHSDEFRHETAGTICLLQARSALRCLSGGGGGAHREDPSRLEVTLRHPHSEGCVIPSSSGLHGALYEP